MTRGFSAIGLSNPKSHHNVGSVLRAAACYDAAIVISTGERYSHSCCDTTKAWRHRPLIHAASLREAVPHGAVPVAVDLVPGAIPLPQYRHRERAFYVFGPEDGTLDDSILNWCRDVIMIPTSYCMNLSACVNVVLYDRMAKQ